MKHQYRLVKVDSSNGPTDEQLNHTTTNTEPGRQTDMMHAQTSKSHPWRWVGITVVAVVLICALGGWMSHVSTSLQHVNHVASSNAKTLGHVQNQLTGIRGELNTISTQISQLTNDIRTFFATIVSYLSQH